MADSNLTLDTVFEESLWPLVEDYSNRNYGYINNYLSLYPWKGEAYRKFVQIPTGMFSALEAIYGPLDMVTIREGVATLALHETDKRHWVLVVVVRNAAGKLMPELSRQLWRYTPAQMPGWLLLRGGR